VIEKKEADARIAIFWDVDIQELDPVADENAFSTLHETADGPS